MLKDINRKAGPRTQTLICCWARPSYCFAERVCSFMLWHSKHSFLTNAKAHHDQDESKKSYVEFWINNEVFIKYRFCNKCKDKEHKKNMNGSDAYSIVHKYKSAVCRYIRYEDKWCSRTSCVKYHQNFNCKLTLFVPQIPYDDSTSNSIPWDNKYLSRKAQCSWWTISLHRYAQPAKI